MPQNPLSLITDPFGPAPGPRPFEWPAPRPASLISDPFEGERLTDAARRAAATSAERAARVLKAQRQTGFPLELIDRNLDEVERQAAAIGFDAERLRAESPLLARWLAEHPSHLALAGDDLRPLSLLEGTLRVGTNSARAFAAGVNRFNVGAWGLLQAAGELTGVEAVAALGAQQGAVASAIADVARGSQAGAGFVERGVYGGIESLGLMVPGLVLAGVGGGSTAVLGTFGGATGGEAYAEARAAGVGVGRAAGFALSQAAVEVATEKLPVSWLLKDLRRHTGFVTMLTRQGIAEIPGEQIATALQDLNAWAVLHPEAPARNYLDARPSAAAQTLIATLTAVGGQTAIASAVARVAGGPDRVLTELGSATRESKTAQRMPDQVADLVAAATVDGPLETVYLPVASFATYWRERGVDPADMAARLTGERRALETAAATGEDLAVPLPVYVRELAGTEHNSFFATEARFAPETPNARETQALDAQLDAEVRAAVEAGVLAEAPEPLVATPVEEAVLTLLTEAGEDPTVAQSVARLYGAAFGTLAARAGLDPVQLFERTGLTVEREAPAVEAPAGEAPAAEAGQAVETGAPAPAAGEPAAGTIVPVEPGAPALPPEFIAVGEEPPRPAPARSAEQQTALHSAMAEAERIAAAQGRSLTDEERAAVEARALEPVEPGAEARMAEGARGRVPPGETPPIDTALRGEETQADETGTESGGARPGAAGRIAFGRVPESVPPGRRVRRRHPRTGRVTEHIRAIPETPAQLEARRRAHHDALFASVLEAAHHVDPSVDPVELREELESRLRLLDEMDAVWNEAGENPQRLLEAIAASGGINLEAEAGGYAGELRSIRESRMLGPFGEFAGVRGVFRSRTLSQARGFSLRGHSLDDMVSLLRQDQEFQWIEDINDLLDALDDVSRGADLEDRRGVFYGTDDLGRVGIAAYARWWTEDLSGGPRTFAQADRGRITIGRRQVRIELLKTANLSTFLHESGHLWLEVLGDIVAELGTRDAATLTDEQRQMTADYRTVLDWLGVRSRDALGTAQHEQFALGVEVYLLEGEAPSAALRPVFARVRAWLVQLYESLRRLDVRLTPEVRAVFDRLLATDVAIDAASADAGAAPLFPDDAAARAAGLSADDVAAYRATLEAASQRARDTVSRQLLAQLQRERARWWRDERQALRAEVAAEIGQQPIYRALALLQHTRQPDGSPLDPGVAFKLSKRELVREFGKDVLAQLPRPLVYATTSALPVIPPAMAAEMLGFPSARALVDALRTAPTFDQAVDAATDAQMRERHGDLLLDGRLGEVAETAVLDAGAEVFAAELAFLERLAARDGQRVTPTSVRTLREAAARRVAGLTVRELRPGVFAAAARRAGARALEAAGRQDRVTALEAKRQQVLNAELYRAATAAVETIDEARADFRRVFARDAALAKGYNMDLVQAARALLGDVGLAPRQEGQRATAYLDQVAQYDPQTFEDLQAARDAAALPAKPWRSLTLDEFAQLRNAVLNLWHLARRSHQIRIAGQLEELADVRAQLTGRLEVLTSRQRRTYKRKLTRWQETKRYLLGWRAALRRVEHWVEAVDGGDPAGVFRRLLHTPIAEAAAGYRVAKKAVLERYLAIVKGVEGSLTTADLAAPEIDYTFSGKAELLHALLHTGNESNLRKLLLGDHETRPRWGTLTEEDTLDTSAWDRFIQRMWREGVLTKTDYDYVQGVWDLNESLKPEAQRVHHELYGHYFNEITAREVVTPFGTYRGGYVPAIYDPFLDDDAARRADKEAIDHTPSSFMFPTTGRGFTIKRIDPYVRPLMLDLRTLPLHLDKVLRFIHLQPVVKDAGRLVIHKRFRSALAKLDPTVAGELLVPWLQRAARQTVDTPSTGWGGRGADRFFRALRRRTGLQIMVGNVVNTLQQFTGLSLSALKVPQPALARALWRYVRGPRVLSEAIGEKSAFMRTRTTTQVMEIQATIDDLLLDPSKYEQARAFATRHGYFLQQATQNVVDLVTWSATYDHQIAEGATDVEAVQRADAVVRLTQGSFDPEDLSSFETGSPFMRTWTMFYSYFSMASNLLGTEFAIAVRELGLKAGAGRLLYVYTFGFMLPAVLSEIIVKAGSGDWDEDEDGQVLDDLLVLFFGAQRRFATAMVPVVGQAVNAGLNAWNDRWYDDKISVSPAVQAIESAVRAPHSVYEAVVNDGRRKTAIKDVLTTIGLLTGLPVAPLGRPLGYLADVAEGREEPETPADLARGLVVGR